MTDRTEIEATMVRICMEFRKAFVSVKLYTMHSPAEAMLMTPA